MSIIDEIFSPLIKELTKGWLDSQDAPRNEFVRLFVYTRAGFKKTTGIIVERMCVEAGLNQPDDDCEYTCDEHAFLKPGVYAKTKNYDELDPVLVHVKPLAFKPISNTDIKGGER